jgi:hypothetical protein
MNELQIRLTADIKDLQSAINKAKATLKSFESETSTDSEKSNVGFRRKIGLIEQLTAKAKALKVSLSQATNEQQIASFNAELEQTNQELTRLNSLGKSFANTSSQSFDKFRVSAGAATGSAIAFNRIIQDAPFGIIGIGNNIQQFAEQLTALKGTTGSTGAALKSFFTSLISPANLLVLGVSAVTAAFTAYALSAEQTKSPVEELKQAQDDFNKSLKDTNLLLGQGLLNNLLKEVGLIKTENLAGRLVDVPAFKTAGEVVDALSEKINNLRKGELELLEGFLNEQIATATRAFANANDSVIKSLATDDINLYRGILEKVNQQLKFYKDVSDDAKESADGLNRVLDEQILILERFGNQAEFASKKLEELLKYEAPEKDLKIKIDIDESQLEGLELPNVGLGLVQTFEKQISDLQELIRVTSDPEALARYQDQLKSAQNGLSALLGNSKLQVEDLAQAFTGLGSVIGRAFNNPQLGTFLGEFLRFAAKLVAANFKIAGSNAVAGASQAAAATGPAAPITLPAFIAGALGVVAAAFAAFGNFGSSGGGSMSAGQGSTFTNRREFGGPVSKGRAYIVGERRPELFVPNTNGVIIPQVPSMDYSGTSMSAGAMAIDVNIQGVSYGDDILFTVQQAQIRRGIR